MNCELRKVRQLSDGKWLVRCPKCDKHRTVANPERYNTTCGVSVGSGYGPGTELGLLFRELNITPDKTCGCKNYSRKMNRWGVTGCRAKLAEIVAHLKAKAAKFGLATWAAAGWSALWQGKPLTIERLVLLAIERSEHDQPSCSSSAKPATP